MVFVTHFGELLEKGPSEENNQNEDDDGNGRRELRLATHPNLDGTPRHGRC